MPHKRTSYSIQCREAARIVSQAAVKDTEVRESINILSSGRIAKILQNRFGTFDLQVINSYDVGEVLRQLGQRNITEGGVLRMMSKKVKNFLKNALIPYISNPGGFNVDAILVIGGALVWGICAIQAQITGGAMIPEVSEIGKACIFVGIGRATKTTTIDSLGKRSQG